jgi:transposase InsO family protein
VDLVNREFVATRPNQLWIADFTYGGDLDRVRLRRVRHRRVFADDRRLARVLLDGRIDPSVGSVGDSYDNRRLLGPIGDIPPVEFEQAYYKSLEAPAVAAGLN